MIADIGKPPAFLLADKDIPPSPMERDQGAVYQWYSPDSEARNRKDPHPSFGPTDIEYRFNRHGYRCAEFEEMAQQPEDAVTLACIGSSGLFGTGLPEPFTLPRLLQAAFQDYLGRPVQSWNLGLGGSGPGYVTRMLFSVLPVMKPDLVLLTTHPFNRREFIGETGRIYAVQSYAHWQHFFTDPERRQMQRACNTISNPYNHLMQFVTNAKVWESLCDDAEAIWLFMTEGYSEHIEAAYAKMREPKKMVGPGFFPLTKKHRDDPGTGLARDMLHPGIRPMHEIVDTLMSAYKAVYANRLDALKRTPRELSTNER